MRRRRWRAILLALLALSLLAAGLAVVVTAAGHPPGAG
jgi:hypothetical protein